MGRFDCLFLLDIRIRTKLLEGMKWLNEALVHHRTCRNLEMKLALAFNSKNGWRRLNTGVISFLLLILLICDCKAQENGSVPVKEKHYSKVQLSIGFNAQTFAFKKNTHGIRKDVMLALGKRNAEGIGLATDIYLVLSKTLNLEYSPTWRYDVVRPRSLFRSISDPVKDKDKYGFFTDHHFSLTFLWDLKEFKFIRQPLRVGLGYSIISLDQTWDYNWHIVYLSPPYYRSGPTIDFQFEGYHIFLRIPVCKNFHLEPKLLYAPEGQLVYNAFQREYMFHVKLGYKMNKVRLGRNSN